MTVAELNSLKFQSYDILDSYLAEKFRDNICTSDIPYFGFYSVNIMVVERELYVLKSSGAEFKYFLVNIFQKIGYGPSSS